MSDINRIQLQLDKHSTQIAKLFSKVDDTNAKIQKIFNILNQIRYFIYGGFAFFVATEIGFMQALELI
jgi:hypothetical protein|tara:strand:+ start:504 stop:707 length:204 start_codon:yes stop_codon:yes gene_type:complete